MRHRYRNEGIPPDVKEGMGLAVFCGVIIAGAIALVNIINWLINVVYGTLGNLLDRLVSFIF